MRGIEEARSLAGISEAARSDTIPPSDKTGEDEDYPEIWRKRWDNADIFDAHGKIGRTLSDVVDSIGKGLDLLDHMLKRPDRDLDDVLEPSREGQAAMKSVRQIANTLEDLQGKINDIIDVESKKIEKTLRADALKGYRDWQAKQGKK